MFPRDVRLLVDTSPLQNAGTGTIQRVLWSQAYEGDLRELSALQVGVADDILSQSTTHEYRMKVSKSGYFLTCAVLFIVASISSREQEREGYSIPAQRKLLAEY